MTSTVIALRIPPGPRIVAIQAAVKAGVPAAMGAAELAQTVDPLPTAAESMQAGAAEVAQEGTETEAVPMAEAVITTVMATPIAASEAAEHHQGTTKLIATVVVEDVQAFLREHLREARTRACGVAVAFLICDADDTQRSGDERGVGMSQGYCGRFRGDLAPVGQEQRTGVRAVERLDRRARPDLYV